jgi:hypothetical protein
MNFLDQLILPLLIIWFLAIFFIFFKKELELTYKLFFLVVFLLYSFHFQDEIIHSYIRLKTSTPREIISWFYGLGKATYFFLILAWPLALIRLYYSAAYTFSELSLLTLSVVTILYWIFFLLYSYFSTSIDHFLLNILVHFLSF